uniref:PHD-type domain-containing protein n=1 Tax=Esox lucius TaxID=8010 RepID=A0A6Q2XLI0_ESOLU
MEENVSPELSLAPEPEQSQDRMDSSSQVNLEDKVEEGREEKRDQEHRDNATEEKLEKVEQSAKTTSKYQKTWGFRRTTIAKREMPGDNAAEGQDGQLGPVRRSGRQAKRTDKLEEFLLTTKRARTVGRRSAASSNEVGDPPSQTPTDAETASEASFDGNAEAKSVDDKPDSPVRKTRNRKRTTRLAKGRGSSQGGSVSDGGSSDNDKASGDACKGPAVPEDKGPAVPEDKGPAVPEDKGPAVPEDKGPAVPEDKGPAVPEDKVTQVQQGMEPQEHEDVKHDKTSSSNVEVTTQRQQNVVIEDQTEKEEEPESEERTIDTSGKRASGSRSPAQAGGRGTGPNIKTRGVVKMRNNQEDDAENEDNESTSSSSSSDSGDDEGYDPNALYCICRQKHNKRFMICCDRCEEWFHGDCVGITEARGRLMERNGEDYVCPNCTAKKSQTAKPNGKPKTVAHESRKAEQIPSLASPLPLAPAGTEEKGGDDLGIKGRIEKTTNPSGKKKIKIFQAAALEDVSDLPKCIGPGCEKNALKDSVYCGSECILRHAAAAMAAKSITEPKPKDEPKQRDQDKAKGHRKPPVSRATSKKSSGRKTTKKSIEDEASDSEDNEKDSDEEEHAEEQPPPPTMSSWSNDHNYNAVTPEKTAPIAPPTVLNKTCMYLFEGLNNPLLTAIYLLTYRLLSRRTAECIICIDLLWVLLKNHIVFSFCPFSMNVVLMAT